LGLLSCLRHRTGVLFHKLLTINLFNIVTQFLHIVSIQMRFSEDGWTVSRVAYSLTTILILLVLMADTVLLQHLAFLSERITKNLVLSIRILSIVLAFCTLSSYIVNSYAFRTQNDKLLRVASIINLVFNCIFAVYSIGYDSGQVLFIGISILLIANKKQRTVTFIPSTHLIVIYSIYLLLGWTACIGFINFIFDRGNNLFWVKLPTVVTGFQAYLLSLIMKELKSITNFRSNRRDSNRERREQKAQRLQTLIPPTEEMPGSKNADTQMIQF
jgi:predicted membrane protein